MFLLFRSRRAAFNLIAVSGKRRRMKKQQQQQQTLRPRAGEFLIFLAGPRSSSLECPSSASQPASQLTPPRPSTRWGWGWGWGCHHRKGDCFEGPQGVVVMEPRQWGHNHREAPIHCSSCEEKNGTLCAAHREPKVRAIANLTGRDTAAEQRERKWALPFG